MSRSTTNGSSVKPPLPQSKVPRLAHGTAVHNLGSSCGTTLSRESLLSVGSHVADDWRIGDRCFVGGTKPGKIAFLGEVKFQTGEWAGVVLDDGSGKNDGSVSGIRYFQCSPNYGLFCKPSKLTRHPIEKPIQTVPQPDPGAVLSSENRHLSQVISECPDDSNIQTPHSSITAQLAESSSGLSFDASTPLAAETEGFCLGDKVTVSGTKTGTIRYIGDFHLKEGLWVGIELDRALGKNDGSVDGKRYFTCKPMFGLFAPLNRVVKVSAASCLSSLQQTPRVRQTLTSAMRQKSGSQESLSSLTSFQSSASATRRIRAAVGTSSPSNWSTQRVLSAAPVTSTGLCAQIRNPNLATLQDLLREKEQHIEQLIKERDIERGDLAKVLQQADQAAQAAADSRNERQQFEANVKLQMEQLQSRLDQVEKERKELLNSYEEEKRRNEDLSFRIEEESMMRAEIEQINRELELSKQAFGEEEGIMDSSLVPPVDVIPVEELKGQIKSLEEEVSSLKSVLEKSRQCELELREKLLQQETLFDAVCKEKDALVKEKDAVVHKLTQLDNVTKEKELLGKEAITQLHIQFKSDIEILKREKDALLKERDELLQKHIPLGAIVKEKEALLEQTNALMQKLVQFDTVNKEKEELLKEKDVLLQKLAQLEGLQKGNEELLKDKEALLEQNNVLIQKLTQFDTVNKEREELLKEKDVLLQKLADVEDFQKENEESLKEVFLEKLAQSDSLKKEKEELLKEKDVFLQKEAHFNVLRSENETLLREKEDLIQKLNQADMLIKEKHEAYSELSESIKNNESLLEEKSATIAELRSSLMSSENGVAAKSGELQLVHTQLTAANSTILEKESLLSKLNAEKNELELQKLQATGSSEEQLNEIESKHKELADLQSLVCSLEASSSSYLSENQRLSAQLQTAENAHKNVTSFMQNQLHELDTKLINANEAVVSRTQERDQFQEQCNLKMNEVEKLTKDLELCKNEVECLKAQLSASVNTSTSMQSQIQEMERKIANVSLTSTQERRHLEEQLSLKSAEVDKLSNELHLSKNAVAKLTEELSSSKTRVNAALGDSESKLNIALTQLNESTVQLQAQKDEKVHLQNEMQQLKDRLSTADAEVGSLKEQILACSVAQDKDKQSHQERVDNLNKVSEDNLKLNEEITRLTTQLTKAQAEATGNCQRNSVLQEELNNLKSNIKELQEQELKNKETQLQLELLEQRLKSAIQEHERECVILKGALNLSEKKLQRVEESAASAQMEAKSDSSEIERLRTENSNLRQKILQLEEHIACDAIEKLTINSPKTGLNDTNSDKAKIDEQEQQVLNNSACHPLKTSIGNINFLNSVIGDLKRKNDDLQYKIEVITSSVDELGLSKSLPHPPVTRLFCDICEIFDAHDTEDCPQQSIENGTQYHVARDMERPYCESCEMFGHLTGACESATF